ncbi:MAG: caspase family protein, partial [Gemmatimonas sp.]
MSGTGSAGGTSAAAFNPVRLSALSASDLQALLDSRDRYKKAVFAEAIAQLEQSPGLADMRPCTSLREAQAGTCLVTEAIKAQFAAAPAPAPVVAAVPAPAPAPAVTAPTAPAAAPSAVPSAAPAAVPAPAPAPAPAVAVAPEAAAASAFETALSALAERRRVRSAALPQIERKVALVIGVDRYNDPAIPTLANAVRDARAIGRIFESDLGYETVVLENANRAAVVGALNRLALELRPQDSVVVYYAGHGELVQSTQLGYWQLTDADAKRPETWLSNADISRLIGRFGASQVALISDSCYSGSLVAEERLRASTAPVDPVAVLTRKSVVVMTSGGNEPVFDEGKQGHSPFAWNLM